MRKASLMNSIAETAVPWVFAMSILLLFALFHAGIDASELRKQPAYVGVMACRDCHEKEYENFVTYAKKSTSFQSIERVKKELTLQEIEGCYYCHTTGFGKPGGFVNEKETPHLKDAGCEVCHGPGENHVKTKRPDDIKGHLTAKDCEACHISERVKAFRYKPLIRGGAH
jgi:hypothetical protein